MSQLGDHPRCGWAHPCFSNISSSSRHFTAIFLFLSWSAPPTMTGSFGRFLGKRSVRPLESGAPIIFLSLCWLTVQSPFQPQWSHYWSGYRPVSWVTLRMRHTRHCSKQPLWVLGCIIDKVQTDFFLHNILNYLSLSFLIYYSSPSINITKTINAMEYIL